VRFEIPSFMPKKTRPIYTVFFLLLFLDLCAQKFSLNIAPKDSLEMASKTPLEYKNTLPSKEAFEQEISRVKNKLEHLGYLNLQFSIIEKENTLKATLLLSKKVQSLDLYFPEELETPNWVTLSKERRVKIPFEQFHKLLQELTEACEKKGFPFAEIKLQNILQKETTLWADLVIEKNSKRNMDKVVLMGYTKFPKKFLKHHLEISPKTSFSKERLLEASEALKTLSFAKEIKPPETLFVKDSTHIYLYLEERKSNRVDALLGFTSDENTQKLQFNGYIDLELVNRFQKGETLSLFWSNNGNQQEQFRLKTNFPYLFNSPISQKIKFEIYKQDSSFVNIKGETTFDYHINYRQKIGISASTESSERNSTKNESTNSRSFTSHFYGLQYDYLLPHKEIRDPKWHFFIKLEHGKRKTKERTAIQQHLKADISYLGILSKKGRLFVKNETAGLRSEAILFNELFRLGGTNSMRGFNELSLFASRYNYSNIEYRWSTQKESYLYGFSDIGFLEDNAQQRKSKLLSFGLGYANETKTGLLNFSYAFGKTNKESFDLNRGLFHLKWVNFF
jgi:translocation and assembly module TamA